MRRKMTRIEEYWKLICTQSKKGEVRGADLADELDIKRPTVCVYLKRLVDLGVPGRVAAGDACDIEHDLSPKTYRALKQLLNERQVNI